MDIHWIKRHLTAIWCKIKNLEENGGGGTGEIPDHNELQGLQGGGPNEYYHLTEDEYNNLGEIPTLNEVLTSGNIAEQDIILQGGGGPIGIKSGVNDTAFYMDEDSIVGMKSDDGTTQTSVQVNPNNITINSTDPDSGGIVGNQYYGNSPSFGDNNFVQKLYVDNLTLFEKIGYTEEDLLWQVLSEETYNRFYVKQELISTGFGISDRSEAPDVIENLPFGGIDAKNLYIQKDTSQMSDEEWGIFLIDFLHYSVRVYLGGTPITDINDLFSVYEFLSDKNKTPIQRLEEEFIYNTNGTIDITGQYTSVYDFLDDTAQLPPDYAPPHLEAIDDIPIHVPTPDGTVPEQVVNVDYISNMTPPDLTLEQARQNGNVLEGSIQLPTSENYDEFVPSFYIVDPINLGISFGFFSDSDGDRVRFGTNNSSGIGFLDNGLTDIKFLSGFSIKDTGIINISDTNSKGLTGSQEFDKQGDRKAFAQMGDIYDLNLNEITSNGNVTSVGIQFGSSGQINASSESFIFNTTPTNLGTKNVIIGQSAGMNMGATGHRNVIIGIAAGQGVTTGWNNTIIGNSAAPYMTTGYDNVAIGRGAATGLATTGSRNVVIGNGVSQASNQIQTGNVVIGNFLGLSSGDVINNKLAIHANPNYTATTGSPNGTGTAVSYSNALIYGDFSERWFKLNGELRLNPANTTLSDGSEENYLLSKADGTVVRKKIRPSLASAAYDENDGYMVDFSMGDIVIVNGEADIALTLGTDDKPVNFMLVGFGQTSNTSMITPGHASENINVIFLDGTSIEIGASTGTLQALVPIVNKRYIVACDTEGSINVIYMIEI